MAQNDVEEFLLERMQSPKGLGDVMASVGEGLACHPRGAREDSVFYLLCSFEMFPLHGEQNPQDVRLPNVNTAKSLGEQEKGGGRSGSQS